jgi:hypothetical protein
MRHPLYRVTSVQSVAPHTLAVEFDDGTQQVIDFRPVLYGTLLGPLRDPVLFYQVRIDPATLHDWPDLVAELVARARRWEPEPA